MLQILPSNSTSPDEIIRSLCGREGDSTGTNFMKYKGVALDVWRDLNLWVVRYTKRVWLTVDKRTNSIVMPNDYLHFSSISVKDECDIVKTLIINNSIEHDIVDISLASDCNCVCNCGFVLCNKIKGYEAVETVTIENMPNGTQRNFTSIERKRLDANGQLIIERTYPVKFYDENQIWRDVVMRTDVEVLCHLDTDDNGCVMDTKENWDKCNEHCAADTFYTDCGESCFIVPQSEESYGVSEQGNRIVFPSNFSYDKVLLRYYMETDGASYLVPLVAKEAFIAGIKHYTIPFVKKPVAWHMQNWELKYNREKKRLRNVLNRYTIREWQTALNPKRNMV